MVVSRHNPAGYIERTGPRKWKKLMLLFLIQPSAEPAGWCQSVVGRKTNCPVGQGMAMKECDHGKCVKTLTPTNHPSTHWVWALQACQTWTPTKSPIHPLSVITATVSNFDTNKITYPPTECDRCNCVKHWQQQNHLSTHWVWSLQLCQTLTPTKSPIHPLCVIAATVSNTDTNKITYPPTECDCCNCVKHWHQQNHLSTHWVWSLQLCQTLTPTKSPIHPLSVIAATVSNTDNNKITYPPTECDRCNCVKHWQQQNHLSTHWVWSLQLCQTLTTTKSPIHPLSVIAATVSNTDTNKITYPPTECDRCNCVKHWHQQNHLSTHWVWSLQLCQTLTPTKSPIHPLWVSVIAATVSNTDTNKITYPPTECDRCNCVKHWHQQNHLSTHWVWSLQLCQTLTPTKSPIHPLSVIAATVSNTDTNKITYPPTVIIPLM